MRKKSEKNMNEDILITTLLIGCGFMLVGWIWSMLVARKVHVGWFAGMAFVFIITLFLFASFLSSCISESIQFRPPWR